LEQGPGGGKSGEVLAFRATSGEERERWVDAAGGEGILLK